MGPVNSKKKIENGNRGLSKRQQTDQRVEKQPKATNGSSILRETPAPVMEIS